MSPGEFERIRAILDAADAEEPLTAREILALLEEHDRQLARDLGSPHRIATVFGRRARQGDVEVLDGDPYRYRLVET